MQRLAAWSKNTRHLLRGALDVRHMLENSSRDKQVDLAVSEREMLGYVGNHLLVRRGVRCKFRRGYVNGDNLDLVVGWDASSKGTRSSAPDIRHDPAFRHSRERSRNVVVVPEIERNVATTIKAC